VKPILAADVDQGKPEDASPIQQIPLVAANAAAAAAGCRLPTIDEWSAALEADGGVTKSTTGANLRDATWAAQRAAVEQRSGARFRARNIVVCGCHRYRATTDFRAAFDASKCDCFGGASCPRIESVHLDCFRLGGACAYADACTCCCGVSICAQPCR
jgi:hypothetical protein